MSKPINLKELTSSLEDYWREAHRVWYEDDNVYNQQFQGLFQDADYDIPIHASSLGTDTVDIFRNHLRSDEPTVLFHSVGSSREAQDEADKMSRWGRGMLLKERTRDEIDPNLQCAFDLLLRGAACKKILVDTKKLKDPPANRRSKEYKQWEAYIGDHWPFVSRALDPLTVFPSPGVTKPLRFIVEKQRRTVADMRASYPDWPDPLATEKDRNNPGRFVDWVECWTADIYNEDGEVVEEGQYIVEADNYRLIEKRNVYGFVPYIFQGSGLGRRHEDANPSHVYVGILRRKINQIKSIVKLETALEMQALMHVFPTLLTTEDPTKVAKQFKVGPGRIIKHAPGQEPKYLEKPGPDQNILVFLNEVKASVASLNNPALSGIRPSGVDYGIHQAQLTGEALQSIQPVRAALNTIGSETLNMMAKMARIFDIHTSVEGVTERGEKPFMVSGEDFKRFNFGVEFEAVSPAENDRMLMIGMSARRAGDISRRTFFREYAKHVVPDPDEEDAQIRAEAVADQMVASGALLEVVMSEDAPPVAPPAKPEGSAEVPGAIAREVERVAGTPGSTAVPFEKSQEALEGV